MKLKNNNKINNIKDNCNETELKELYILNNEMNKVLENYNNRINILNDILNKL